MKRYCYLVVWTGGHQETFWVTGWPELSQFIENYTYQLGKQPELIFFQREQ